MKNGISVVVCCFNSATRIKPTLIHLSKQDFGIDNDWELILVDNACTDNTVAIATEEWHSYNTTIPLRIVSENKPGLGNARVAGIENSNFKYILFCDDDNWLSDKYLSNSFKILEDDPEIAAVGGLGIAEFEDNIKPNWFDEFQEAYAVGEQTLGAENGKILSLYGAGLTIRKSSFNKILENGFQPFLKDRVGKSLSSSGDTELTNIFVMAGLRLSYSPTMQFKHFIPKSRLTRQYLIKLFKAFGKDGPLRNLYYSFITSRKAPQLIKYWGLHFALSLFRLVKYAIVPPKKSGRYIYFHWNLSYIKSLILIYPAYTGIWLKIALLERRLTNQAAVQDDSVYSMISESPTIQ